MFVGRSTVNVLVRIANGIRRLYRHGVMVFRTNEIGRRLVFLSVASRRNGLYRASHERRTQASDPIYRYARVRRKDDVQDRASGRRLAWGEELESRNEFACVLKRLLTSRKRFLASGLANRVSVNVPFGFRPRGKGTVNKE